MDISDDFNKKTPDELGGELWETIYFARVRKDKKEEVRKALELIEAGADINFSRTEHRSTPLIEAAGQGFIDVVHALVNKGADLNKTTIPHGWSAVMAAIYFCKTDVATFLINKGASLDARGLYPAYGTTDPYEGGDTALSLAKYRGLTDIIKLIEEKTAAAPAPKKPAPPKPPKAA